MGRLRGIILGLCAMLVGASCWGAPARSETLVNGAPPGADLSGYVTKEAMAAAMADATSNASTKLDAVPATGPGAGKCRFSVVPSNLIQSGGVTGTPGTCSRIVQCGTSGAYVVAQFNIGDGC